ncbi:prevent-host-death family protein (plasmid) [Xanthobacter versatilis]|uniref:Antitoxin n=1 Tax=Xanthobacter autotrophicus (strain ATCC BAA-1158 / Py2) TaxID=78245 RepID=A7IQJ4_XANP2|nr:prevent-host-death family protein [Xanthobacter autotrophicus Py2]
MAAPRKSAADRSESWTVTDAKARLSEVIERAQRDPQVIARHGKPSAVGVSAEEWSRKTARRGTLVEFLMASPLRDADLDLERVRDGRVPGRGVACRRWSSAIFGRVGFADAT